MIVALMIGLLTAAGVYLILHRGLIRVIIGFVLLGHAVNILLIAAGGLHRREAPFGESDLSEAADPLPQAFALTAIVITFGITIYLLGLALAHRPDPYCPDLELGEPGPDADGRPTDRGSGPEPVLTAPDVTADDPADSAADDVRRARPADDVRRARPADGAERAS
ncbi:NADH-quinone oxidoreductase subunit K [Solwaraspora sp. WMMD406]|nr:NADH-quinone oxidoreductase subunit K [Solwaraspora sp. WMMD406]MDG4765322.1 NADH-quinone oxidoreductase subunit K [Solwaraspora sp. WMMD406]